METKQEHHSREWLLFWLKTVFHKFARTQWDGDADIAIIGVKEMLEVISGESNEIGQGMVPDYTNTLLFVAIGYYARKQKRIFTLSQMFDLSFLLF